MIAADHGAAILDLDGTVYRGDRLVEGADRTVRALRGAGLDVLFLTDEAIARRRDYAEKLTRLGVPATPADVVNSGRVTARCVADRHPDREALVIGEPPLVEELDAAATPDGVIDSLADPTATPDDRSGPSWRR